MIFMYAVNLLHPTATFIAAKLTPLAHFASVEIFLCNRAQAAITARFDRGRERFPAEGLRVRRFSLGRSLSIS